MNAVPSAPRDLPEYVEGWIRQLLDPDILDLLRHAGDRQIDVRLFASGGRVRRRPVVAFDTGPQEMVDPGRIAGKR